MNVRDEGGWTLVEMLMAAAIGLAVVGTATTLFVSVIQSQPRASEHGDDIQTARTAMERITRELRQGWGVPVALPNQLSILTYTKSATCGGASSSVSRPCRVTYTCGATSCSRVEASPTGASPGPAEIVVTGFTGPNAFTYSPSTAAPTYVGVKLSFPREGGDDTITLEDGVALRNPGPPPS